jgi:ATPase family associated with various cellular activities (AAA)/Lon protease (S16) C-terminal proteolytic domain
MARRITRQVKYVRLPEKRIREINALVSSWPHETQAFMRARLNQYKPRTGFFNYIVDHFLILVIGDQDKHFEIINDPDVITDWQTRFEISGQRNPQDAWNKILDKEITARDHMYLLSLLDRKLRDIYVPQEFRSLFDKIYRAHLRKEYLSDPEVPKSPLILIVGTSGSGKSATVERVIEDGIFANEILPEIDLNQKKEAILADLPFWKTIEEVDPNLAFEITRRRQTRFYHRLSRIPLIRWVFKKRIALNLTELGEHGITVDYAVVTPNEYQTALAGEPGNYFRKAMGDPKKTTIRHIEEAHSAFGKASEDQSGVQRQQRTLVDASNIVLDEIASGRRDCVLVATTDQPERIDGAIYRRFVEKGVIIDLGDYWKNKVNLREVIRIELQRNDIRIVGPEDPLPANHTHYIRTVDLDQSVEAVYRLFQERSLTLTPAYVRKLVHSIIQIQKTFNAADLDDADLVRRAFELVAKNTYGDLYKKVVDRMDRRVKWEEYIGDIKYVFSEMANNCLQYGLSEEKGVVLNGPPGGGKTFLVRTWLSENSAIHDIATSASALQDPVNPVEGAVDNMEKVYDIAKMIAPTVIFFDEGDALAPKRSSTGGSPQDKLTNKFLSLIDGEVPLNQVFTVLTTNRLDILDPALIRSKRLKVLEVTGHLRKNDIAAIVAAALGEVPLEPGLDLETVVDTAQKICNTPADFTAFVEKARSLRSTEYEIILRMRKIPEMSEKDNRNFVKFNLKTLLGMLNALNAPSEVQTMVREDPDRFIARHEVVLDLIEAIENEAQYPLRISHLESARSEISQSPTKKGKVQLDEFLESELSEEPQVGFIVGVGANDVTGVLLPIATSLNYKMAPEKVLVTGAVSTSAPGAAELDMSVKMTQQSAQEALTLVKNFLQHLQPKISIPRLFGEFLDHYTIHHQLLTASYNVGGPSAGYALALNTLSALLMIPVSNDFGVTGAPWTRGAKKGEIGGSVIIGGHKKKTEKVLLHLRRMYMPLQNYKDLEIDYLENYWLQGKDILGVTNFGDLVPEVLLLEGVYGDRVHKLIETRIRYKLAKCQRKRPDAELKEQILAIKVKLRDDMEKEIVRRLQALRAYMRSPVRDPHISLEEIFRNGAGKPHRRMSAVVQLVRNGLNRFRKECRTD